MLANNNIKVRLQINSNTREIQFSDEEQIFISKKVDDLDPGYCSHLFAEAQCIDGIIVGQMMKDKKKRFIIRKKMKSTLNDLIISRTQESSKFSLQFLQNLIKTLVFAISNLHLNQLCHNRIKVGNIFLTEKMEILISDMSCTPPASIQQGFANDILNIGRVIMQSCQLIPEEQLKDIDMTIQGQQSGLNAILQNYGIELSNLARTLLQQSCSLQQIKHKELFEFLQVQDEKIEEEKISIDDAMRSQLVNHLYQECSIRSKTEINEFFYKLHTFGLQQNSLQIHYSNLIKGFSEDEQFQQQNSILISLKDSIDNTGLINFDVIPHNSILQHQNVELNEDQLKQKIYMDKFKQQEDNASPSPDKMVSSQQMKTTLNVERVNQVQKVQKFFKNFHKLNSVAVDEINKQDNEFRNLIDELKSNLQQANDLNEILGLFQHYDTDELKVVDESIFFLVCKLIDKKMTKKKIKFISKKFEKTNKKIDYVKFSQTVFVYVANAKKDIPNLIRKLNGLIFRNNLIFSDIIQAKMNERGLISLELWLEIRKEHFKQFSKDDFTAIFQANEENNCLAKEKLFSDLQKLNEEFQELKDRIMQQIQQDGESFKTKYAEIDENNDGLIDILEFEQFIESLNIGLEFEQIFDIFYRFDKNHSGLIEMVEFTTTLLEQSVTYAHQNSNSSDNNFHPYINMQPIDFNLQNFQSYSEFNSVVLPPPTMLNLQQQQSMKSFMSRANFIQQSIVLQELMSQDKNRFQPSSFYSSKQPNNISNFQSKQKLNVSIPLEEDEDEKNDIANPMDDQPNEFQGSRQKIRQELDKTLNKAVSIINPNSRTSFQPSIGSQPKYPLIEPILSQENEDVEIYSQQSNKVPESIQEARSKLRIYKLACPQDNQNNKAKKIKELISVIEEAQEKTKISFLTVMQQLEGSDFQLTHKNLLWDAMLILGVPANQCDIELLHEIMTDGQLGPIRYIRVCVLLSQGIAEIFIKYFFWYLKKGMIPLNVIFKSYSFEQPQWSYESFKLLNQELQMSFILKEIREIYERLKPMTLEKLTDYYSKYQQDDLRPFYFRQALSKMVSDYNFPYFQTQLNSNFDMSMVVFRKLISECYEKRLTDQQLECIISYVESEENMIPSFINLLNKMQDLFEQREEGRPPREFIIRVCETMSERQIGMMTLKKNLGKEEKISREDLLARLNYILQGCVKPSDLEELFVNRMVNRMEINHLVNQIKIGYKMFSKGTEFEINLEKIIKQIFDSYSSLGHISSSNIQKGLKSFGILKPTDFKKSLNLDDFRKFMHQALNDEIYFNRKWLYKLLKYYSAHRATLEQQMSFLQFHSLLSSLYSFSQSQSQLIFQFLDKHQQSYVDFLEFLNMMLTNLSDAPTIAPLLLKMKNLDQPQLKEYIDIFSILPSNAILSFLRKQNHKQQNLLSQILIQPHQFLKQKVDDKKRCLKLKIKKITGVVDVVLKGEFQIVYREIGICIYSLQSQTYCSNVAYIKAKWNQDATDIWYVNEKKSKSSVYIQYSIDDEVEIILELIITIKHKENLYEVSLGFCTLNLPCSFKKAHELEIQGGLPNHKLNINNQEIHRELHGLNIIKYAFTSTMPQILVTVENMVKPIQINQNYIINKYSVQLVQSIINFQLMTHLDIHQVKIRGLAYVLDNQNLLKKTSLFVNLHQHQFPNFALMIDPMIELLCNVLHNINCGYFQTEAHERLYHQPEKYIKNKSLLVANFELILLKLQMIQKGQKPQTIIDDDVDYGPIEQVTQQELMDMLNVVHHFEKSHE